MMLKKNRVKEFGIQPDETFQNWIAKTPTNMSAKAQALEGKHAVYTVMSLYDNIPDGVIDRLTEFLLARQLENPSTPLNTYVLAHALRQKLATMNRHVYLMKCRPNEKPD